MPFTFSNLKFKSKEEIIYQLDIISTNKEITSLYMCDGDLARLPVEDLIEIMQKIPRHITHLALNNNNFANLSADDFAKVLGHIPQTATSIDLGYNELGTKSGKELNQSITALHKELKSLSLFGNDLYKLSNDGFIEAFDSLDRFLPDLANIDLRGNELGKKSFTELSALLDYLQSLKATSNINYNAFFANKSFTEQKELLGMFAKTLNKNESELCKSDNKGAEKVILSDLSLPIEKTSLALSFKQNFSVALVFLLILASLYTFTSLENRGPSIS